MGRRRAARKGKSEKTQDEREMEDEREEEEEGEGEDGSNGDGFFACYLLCSLSPRHRGHTYIGFTVNPRRRIRQHNGEMRSGAWRTKRGRPWEMVLCIYGFPTNVSALQFEWAWQHPTESLAVRKAASNFKSLAGIANKIKIAYTMLNLPSWDNLNLTVNFFSTKHMKHLGGCPRLPKQMKVNVSVMDELPCYVKGEVVDHNECDGDESEYEEEKINECISSPFTKSDSSANEIGENACSYEQQKPSPTKSSVSEVPIDCSFKCFSGNIDSHNETEVVDELLLSPLRSNVINLSSPYSCIVGKCNKRAKACLEIIDLTDSPTIIQL